MADLDFLIERMILKTGNKLHNLRHLDLEQRNLTAVQSETLLFFGSNEGASISKLKEHLQVSHQAARNTVERLKVKNYVYAEDSEIDGRYKKIFLTEEGWQMYRSLKMEGSRIGTVLLEGFSAEEKNLLYDLIMKASDNLK